MLNYETLKNKPTLSVEVDGRSQKVYDLLQQSIGDYSNDAERLTDFIVCNEYYVARPDLISLALYGTDEYADILCKINGISNPFELNEGMLIFYPSLSIINKIKDEHTHKAMERIDSDSSIIAKTESVQKQKNERRSPVEQIVGDKNYLIDKSLGVVFY